MRGSNSQLLESMEEINLSWSRESPERSMYGGGDALKTNGLQEWEKADTPGTESCRLKHGGMWGGLAYGHCMLCASQQPAGRLTGLAWECYPSHLQGKLTHCWGLNKYQCLRCEANAPSFSQRLARQAVYPSPVCSLRDRTSQFLGSICDVLFPGSSG